MIEDDIKNKNYPRTFSQIASIFSKTKFEFFLAKSTKHIKYTHSIIILSITRSAL